MELFTYWRSSTAYRVRIGLHLKGLAYTPHAVNLLKGEQRDAAYVQKNPLAAVPTLVDGGHTLIQSLAILEYLDETHPTPPLLPADPLGRARVRALAQTIACDMHALNNLKVTQYLAATFGISDPQKTDWMHHWMHAGLRAFEAQLNHPHTGLFCHGDTPTLADLCLVPQVYNARRFNVDLAAYPRLTAVADRAAALPAFAAAHPDTQPDRA